MKLLSLILCLIAQQACGQAFSFRDTPFLITTFTPAAGGGGNNAVFNSVANVWHCEETAGNTRADSKGSATLTETGGQVGSTTGIHNTAARFFVTDQGDLLSGSTAITPGNVNNSVSLWVKVHARPAVATTVTLFVLQGDDPEVLMVLNSDGTVTCAMSIEDSSIITSALSLDVWHNLVFSCDGTGDIVIYLDGVSTDTTISNGHAFANTQAQIGGGTLNVADVAIDEVCFWPIALTSGNATTLWNSGSGTFFSP